MARNAKRRQQPKVAADVMVRRVIKVHPEMTLREVAKVFLDRKITGAPVVDEDNRLVGVISQTDLVRYAREEASTHETNGKVPPFYQEASGLMLRRGFHLEVPDYTRVRDVMTPAVFEAEERTPIAQIARFMLRRHVHRVIVTRKGTLCGIVSSTDLLRVLC